MIGSDVVAKRIVWVDDNEAFFQRLAASWPRNGLPDYELVFCPLVDLIAENGIELGKMLDAPPDVLLLDWSEFATDFVYQALKAHIPISILVSVAPHETLAANDVFAKYPELHDKTLQSPFTADALGKFIRGLQAQDQDRIEDVLAIRYLNQVLQPTNKTKGWRLDLQNPELTWTELQRTELEQGKTVQHSVFMTVPNAPDKFGPVQLITQKLPGNATAAYMQQAFEFPETGAGLEVFGRSVDGIITLMIEAGFSRGRYYHLSEIPGLPDYALEMVSRVPLDSGTTNFPAVRQIDSKEKETFLGYCTRYQNRFDDALIYDIKEPGLHAGGVNADFWSDCINMNGILAVLRVPIFLTETELATKHPLAGSEGLRLLRGEFVFDKGIGKPIEGKDVKAIERTLLAAIKYFGIARKEEYEHFQREKATMLLAFQRQLAREESTLAIEMALTNKLIEIVQNTPRTLGEKSQSIVSSAMYARHEKQQKTMRISYETDGLMTGALYSLIDESLSDLVVVKCALMDISHSSQPLVVPYFELEAADAKRIETVSKLPGLLPANIGKIAIRMKNDIRTLAAFPVRLDATLLGVVVVRSNQPYEFISRVVEKCQALIEIACLYLARLQTLENKKIWDGLVMHEMRAMLTWAKSKASSAEHAQTPAAQSVKIKDLLQVLDNGIDLSTLFMRWRGLSEGQLKERPTSDKFWQRIHGYGLFMQRNVSHKKWVCAEMQPWMAHEKWQVRNGIFLERVMHIFIDNAFRYAVSESDVVCTFNLDQANRLVEVTIQNRADNAVVPEALRAVQQGQALINWVPNSRAEIGLTLANMLCLEMAGKPLSIEVRRQDDSQLNVVATVVWPCVDEFGE
ncbi:MAG: hypothetical protein RL748_2381 [Pseudomonadota bacterium]|jgi:hypothetical protein